MKGIPMKKLIGTAAIGAVLLGSLALAAPASAQAPDLTGVGVVVVEGAGEGIIVRVTQTGATAQNALTVDAAADRQSRLDSASADALAAQAERNADFGVSTAPRIVDGVATWTLVTDETGTVTVPATGAASTTVTARAAGTSGTVEYAPTAAWDASTSTITWTDHIETSGDASADERTIEHRLAQAGRIGYDLTLTR